MLAALMFRLVTRHGGRGRLVFESVFRGLERRRADEDLLAVLHGHDAPRGEAAAVPAAIHAVDDGLREIPAPQEIRVHRVHDPAVVDRAVRGHERLAENLPAEHLGAARVAAFTAKQVDLQALELELLLQVGETRVHPHGTIRT